MGLFDQLAGQVLGGASGTAGTSQQGALLTAVTGLIAANGGVGGLLQKFKDSGMEDHVASWVGTGENRAISGSDVTTALGDDAVQKVAAEAGVSTDHAASGLAQLLPQIISQLSPNGELPHGDLLTQGLGMLKGKLFG
jgi:uncharacterized protein YidB (DUF937 family)